MWETGALGVSDGGEVLDQICDGGRGARDGLNGLGDMVGAASLGLQEMREVGSAQGERVGIVFVNQAPRRL